MPNLTYTAAHAKDPVRVVLMTDVLPAATTLADPNQGITVQQLSDFVYDVQSGTNTPNTPPTPVVDLPYSTAEAKVSPYILDGTEIIGFIDPDQTGENQMQGMTTAQFKTYLLA